MDNICDLDKNAPYYAKYEYIETKPGCWNYTNVNILERATEKIIGSYQRNYSNMFRTFYPFFLKEKWYALYSPNYTGTRIMSLPDCKDIGGEEKNANGFCPVDFHVPESFYFKFKHYDDCKSLTSSEKCDCSSRFVHRYGCPFNSDTKVENKSCICNEEHDIAFNQQYKTVAVPRVHGFVAGCVWGDDSSYKIQYLDLSRADEGIIKRDNRFGYIELPRGMDLNSAINFEVDDDYIFLDIAISKHFNIDGSSN
jgi:hypothetical protein